MDRRISRRWMYNRFLPKNHEYTQEFLDGVMEFIKFACTQSEFIRNKKLRCPCFKCRNLRFFIPDEVHEHLLRHGFVSDYWYWTNHGECEPNDFNDVGASSSGPVVYQKKSTTNKRNRASDCSGQGYPLHKGGSISHLQHKDRLEAQLGRPVGLAESFKHTHSSLNKETGEIQWVDERSKNTYFEFKNRCNKLSSQNSNPNGEHGQDEEECHQSTMPDEIQVWMDVVGGPKKGRLYGVPGYVSTAASSSRAGSSGVYNQQLLRRTDAQQQKIHAQQQEINNVRAENKGLKNELTSMKSKLSSVESKLDQVLSMTAFFSSVFHNMQAPTPPGLSDIRSPAYNVPPAGYQFMPIPGLFPPFPNVSPPARSSSPTNEDNDDE